MAGKQWGNDEWHQTNLSLTLKLLITRGRKQLKDRGMLILFSFFFPYLARNMDNGVEYRQKDERVIYHFLLLCFKGHFPPFHSITSDSLRLFRQVPAVFLPKFFRNGLLLSLS